MSIVASEIVEDRVQADGRRRVHERHTDNFGRLHDVFTLIGATDRADDLMAARIPRLEEQLSETEIAANVDAVLGTPNPTPTFVNSTRAQLLAVLRRRFRDGAPVERHRIARFIWSLGLTDNQLMALFGVTDAQLPALKTRLQNMTARIDALDAEEGI